MKNTATAIHPKTIDKITIDKTLVSFEFHYLCQDKGYIVPLNLVFECDPSNRDQMAGEAVRAWCESLLKLSGWSGFVLRLLNLGFMPEDTEGAIDGVEVGSFNAVEFHYQKRLPMEEKYLLHTSTSYYYDEDLKNRDENDQTQPPNTI
jgi:hypothetical protein